MSIVLNEVDREQSTYYTTAVSSHHYTSLPKLYHTQVAQHKDLMTHRPMDKAPAAAPLVVSSGLLCAKKMSKMLLGD